MHEEVLDARFLLEKERFHSGLILDLKSHIVFVGERIISNSLVLGVQLLKSTSSKLDNSRKSNISEVTNKDLALDFSRAVSFEAACKSKFGHPVPLPTILTEELFLLVVSFGSTCFKLDIHTVAITLQTCFGGNDSSFKVRHLRDRTFQFSVASTTVGFEIYNQSKVCTPMFELFLNIWGQGGPNLLIEEKKYYKAIDLEWQEVQRKKSSFLGSKRMSVFQRMQFPPLSPLLAPNLYSTFQTATTSNRADDLQSFLSKRNSFRANLPGLDPFFKFPSFTTIQWPDDSYLT
jgi:hypothetical protein